MFTVTDMQNFNNDPKLGPTNKNYYQFGVTYNYLRNRFYVAYGRTREGYNCSGRHLPLGARLEGFHHLL